MDLYLKAWPDYIKRQLVLDYALQRQIKMKFYVGINMLKGLKIGLGKLDLKIHRLPIQQLEAGVTPLRFSHFKKG